MAGGLFGSSGSSGGSGTGDVAHSAAGVDIQTSCYGSPITIVQGTTRISGNLIDYANFYGVAQYRQGSSGGGGKGGGGGGGSTQELTGYIYYVDQWFALCEGPIFGSPDSYQPIPQPFGVLQDWDGQSIYNPIITNQWQSVPGSYNPAYQPVTQPPGVTSGRGLPYMGCCYVVAGAKSLGSNANMGNYNWEVQGWNAALNMVWGGSGSYSATYGYGYFLNHMAAFNNSPVESATALINTSFVPPVGGLKMTVNNSGTPLSISVADADPSLCIIDVLCNPYYGAGFPAANLGGQELEDEAHTASTSGVLVNRTQAYLYNVNVKNNTSSQLMKCMAYGATLTAGQYYFDPYLGKYFFSSADNGNSVNIRYASNTGLSEMQAFCLASNLVISPAYDTQTACSSMIDDICKTCYVSAVWSAGTLNFKPRSSVSVTGNGWTWTAPSAALYGLGDDDFMDVTGNTASSSGGSTTDPLQIHRNRPADQLNDIKIEFLDGGWTPNFQATATLNQFAPGIAEIFDQAHIDVFGKRTQASQTLHLICNVTTANVSAQLQLQDQHILNMYSFQLDERYSMLDPMDLLQVTDTLQSITQVWVRVVELTENDDGTISFIAEEYPHASGGAVAYKLQGGGSTPINYGLGTGPVNRPVFFAMPPQIASNQALELGLAITGSTPANYGGCDIWVASQSGGPYALVGRQIGAARMGTTTAALPTTLSSPLPVVLNGQSTGTNSLQAGTLQDAADGNTHSLVQNTDGTNAEFIAYSGVSPLGGTSYLLVGGGDINRGLYNSLVTSHPINSDFVRIDDNVYQLAYKPEQIGKTLYMKFTPFNLYGAGETAISDGSVVTYAFTVPQPPLPPDVTGFVISQSGTSVVFGWNSVSYPLVALAGYDIGYAPVGTTNWSSFTLLTRAQGGSGTEMTNANVPAGTWAFGIRAVNIANTGSGSTIGLSPDITIANFTVLNNSGSISAVEQSPNFPGTLEGFVLDYRGYIIPCNTKTPAQYTDFSFFDFVPDPVGIARYTAPTVNAGLDETMRISATFTGLLGPRQTGSFLGNVVIGSDSWLTAGTDNKIFTPISGVLVVNARFVRVQLQYTPTPGDVAYFTQFLPKIDQSV